MASRIAVLDYGSGNLGSVERALIHIGADVTVTADPDVCANADGLVVPGVGAFAACMEGLEAVNGERIVDQRLAGGRPVLGICVGMQVMFDSGIEFGVKTAGFGQWPGTVEKLEAPVLPHMGWNTVQVESADGGASTLFAGLDPQTRFYFVHSYATQEWVLDVQIGRQPVLAWSEHGQRFLAAAELGALSTTQFHPEKSGDAGMTVLRNWMDSL